MALQHCLSSMDQTSLGHPEGVYPKEPAVSLHWLGRGRRPSGAASSGVVLSRLWAHVGENPGPCRGGTLRRERQRHRGGDPAEEGDRSRGDPQEGGCQSRGTLRWRTLHRREPWGRGGTSEASFPRCSGDGGSGGSELTSVVPFCFSDPTPFAEKGTVPGTCSLPQKGSLSASHKASR